MKKSSTISFLCVAIGLSASISACSAGEPSSAAPREAVAQAESAAVVACQDDNFEPNQSAVTAVNLPFGSQLAAMSCPQNVDFYSFQGPAAGTPFTVSLIFQSDDFEEGTDTGDLNALLRDQAGNLLFIGDRVAKDNEFLPAVSDGGVYSLEIQSALRPVPYTLAVSPGNLRCGILDDALEPNQDIRGASLLGSAPVQAYICRGDSDFYRIQGPPAGQLLAVDLAYTPARGTLGIRLFDRNGDAVGPDFLSNEPQVTRRVNSDGGVYYAEVFGNGKESGNYQIQARTEVPNCAGKEDPFEPNDTALSAAPITFPGSIAGSMCQGGRDFYRFTGPAVGTPFNVSVSSTNTVTLEITDSQGHAVYSSDFFRGGTIHLVSDGRDYVVSIRNVGPFDPIDAAYTIDLGLPAPDTSCDLKRDLEPLGQACKVANAGPFQAVDASVAASPDLVTDRLYVIKLKSSIDPTDGTTVYGATARFTAPETASYALFTGSPGVPLTLSQDAAELSYACSQSFGLNDCNKLLRGSRFELSAGHTYALTIGPIHAAAPPSVRLGWERVADFTAPPLCKELRNIESTCTTADADIQTIAASPLGQSSAIPVVENASYGVRLALGATENSGAVSFTPAISGQYLMYLGTPGVRFRVLDGSSELAPDCASKLPIQTCTKLREAVAYDLSGGHTYQLEFGPTSPQSYIRFMVQPNIPVVGECDLAELNSLAPPVCGVDPSAVPVLDLSGGAIFGIADEHAVNLKLRPTETAFRGQVRYFPFKSDTFAVYAGSAAVPVTVTGAFVHDYIAPLCSARLPTGSCGAYKIVYLYRAGLFRGLNIDFGPSNPQQWLRFVVSPEIKPVQTQP